MTYDKKRTDQELWPGEGIEHVAAESILARNISAAGDKAVYDAACKRLLSNKIILSWIMKSCLTEYRDFGVDEIADRYIEGDPQAARIAVHSDEDTGADTLERGERIFGAGIEDSTVFEGTVTYDIRFYAIVPVTEHMVRLIINLEAQTDFYPGYPLIKRGIYYCSRMISSQYGTEFADSHYEKLKKVCSIWICMNPPKERENTITRYRLCEENMVGTVAEEKENYDLMEVIMVCLGDPQDDNCSGVLKLLEVLFSPERRPDEKKKILQEEFGIKMTRDLEREVSDMCNLSDGVERRGIEKGIQLGIKEGVLVCLENLIDSMGWSAEQAMAALKVPEADRPQYASLLKGSGL